MSDKSRVGRTGGNDTGLVHHAPISLEPLAMREKHNDILPTDEIAAHGIVRSIAIIETFLQ